MAEQERYKNEVVFKKEIITDDPDAYAAVTLSFEGLTEERTGKLRELFNGFYKEVEEIVKKETSLME